MQGKTGDADGRGTHHPSHEFTGVVRAFRAAGMGVGICTNGTTLTDMQITELAGIGEVHVNVSLDGFRPESHGLFRGDRTSFDTTVTTVRTLGESRAAARTALHPEHAR